MTSKRIILVLIICTIIFSLATTAFAIEPATTTSSSTTLDRANAIN